MSSRALIPAPATSFTPAARGPIRERQPARENWPAPAAPDRPTAGSAHHFGRVQVHSTTAAGIQEPLQAKENPGEVPEVTPRIHRQIESFRHRGEPLPRSVRSDFESRFGVDFGAVRIHTEPRAAQAAQDLRARAFTTGWNIAFAQGQFAPDTFAGRKLLAHELTHTLQQNASHDRSPSGSARRRSDALTSHVAGPNEVPSAPVQAMAPAPRVQRAEGPVTTNRAETAQGSREPRGEPAGFGDTSHCCCVDDVDIPNVQKLNDSDGFGHAFLTKIALKYERWNQRFADCTLEWWEHSNRVPEAQRAAGIEPGKWHDLYAGFPDAGAFDHWNGRGRGPEDQTRTIRDDPQLVKRRGRNAERTIHFAIRARSAPGCPCEWVDVTQFATQVLQMEDGQGVDEKFSRGMGPGVELPPYLASPEPAGPD